MNSHVRPTPLTDRLYDYALSVGLREPAVLRRLRDETARLPDGEMQTAPEQGPLLDLLVRLLGATQVLEVGTFTGFKAGQTKGDKIDYIFVEPGTEVTRAEILRTARDGRYPSDHFPVVAIVKLKP